MKLILFVSRIYITSKFIVALELAVCVSNNTKLLPETPEGRLVMDAMDLSLHTLIDIYYPLVLASLTALIFLAHSPVESNLFAIKSLYNKSS